MSPPLDPGSVLRTGLPGELHQLVAVLTDEPFLVVASDVVPHRSVAIEVVEDRHTGLVMLPLHPELSVVGLRLAVTPGLAPVPGDLAVTTTQSHVRPSPEPTWNTELYFSSCLAAWILNICHSYFLIIKRLGFINN